MEKELFARHVKSIEEATVVPSSGKFFSKSEIIGGEKAITSKSILDSGNKACA